MASSGLLTYEQFLDDCTVLFTNNETEQQWILQESKYFPRRKFLVLKTLSKLKKLKPISDTFQLDLKTDKVVSSEDIAMGDGFDLSDEDDSNECTVNGNVDETEQNVQEQIFSFEYHVIFSESYSVPTLFFNASRSDGSSVPLETIWSNVPDIHQHSLQERYSFISQQEHPYLGYPFYYIHPCHTADLMANLLDPRDDAKRCLHGISTFKVVKFGCGFPKSESCTFMIAVDRRYCGCLWKQDCFA